MAELKEQGTKDMHNNKTRTGIVFGMNKTTTKLNKTRTGIVYKLLSHLGTTAPCSKPSSPSSSAAAPMAPPSPIRLPKILFSFGGLELSESSGGKDRREWGGVRRCRGGVWRRGFG